MRKVQFVTGEYYHIFNRGADKRSIFDDRYDYRRFMQSMDEFNTMEPIGSIFENSFRRRTQLGNGVSKIRKSKPLEPLVSCVAYCLNPNHYHFVLRQLVDRGIAKFMHKLGLGYTKYFNQKNRRNGVLFQGPFRGVHIESNEYLLYVSAYVNLNDRVHNKLGNGVSKSSWDEYLNRRPGFCDKGIILEQFKSPSGYRNFAEGALKIMLERKEMEYLLLETVPLGNPVSKSKKVGVY